MCDGEAQTGVSLWNSPVVGSMAVWQGIGRNWGDVHSRLSAGWVWEPSLCCCCCFSSQSSALFCQNATIIKREAAARSNTRQKPEQPWSRQQFDAAAVFFLYTTVHLGMMLRTATASLDSLTCSFIITLLFCRPSLNVMRMLEWTSISHQVAKLQFVFPVNKLQGRK